MYVEVLKNCINNKIKTYNSQQYFNKILECFNRIKKSQIKMSTWQTKVNQKILYKKKLYQEVYLAKILNMICTTKSKRVGIMCPKHHNVKTKIIKI